MWRNRNSYLQVGSTVWTPHTTVSLSIVYKVEAEPAWLWDSFHEEWIRKETGSGLIKCCSWSCRNSKRLCHDSILDDRTLDDFVFHQNTWAGSLLDASTTQVHAEYTYMIINHHKEENWWSLLLAGCHLAWFWRKSPSVSSKYGSRGRRSTVVEKATGSDGCLLFRLKGCTRAGFHTQTMVMTMIRDWIKLRFQMQRNSYWISISFGFLIITSYEL